MCMRHSLRIMEIVYKDQLYVVVALNIHSVHNGVSLSVQYTNLILYQHYDCQVSHRKYIECNFVQYFLHKMTPKTLDLQTSKLQF